MDEDEHLGFEPLTVKEWREKLAALPDDALVSLYYTIDDDGIWLSVSERFQAIDPAEASAIFAAAPEAAE